MPHSERGGKEAEWWRWGQVGSVQFLCCWAVLSLAVSVQAEQFSRQAPEGLSRSAGLENGPNRVGWVPKRSEFSDVRAGSLDRAAWIPKGSEFSGVQVRRPRPTGADSSPIGSAGAVRTRKRRDALHDTPDDTPDDTPEKLRCSAPQEERLPFLRYPLRFTRISSGFSHTRFHPILKRTRPHRGVDFVAPRGTPVRAVAAGRVTHAGWLGGLGRVVRIKHPGPYRSDYGHLDRLTKAAKLGRTVKRGQVIGYVGTTGLATGPHLHFGLSKHGRYINPLTEQLPRLAVRAPAKKSQPFGFRRNHTQQVYIRTTDCYNSDT